MDSPDNDSDEYQESPGEYTIHMNKLATQMNEDLDAIENVLLRITELELQPALQSAPQPAPQPASQHVLLQPRIVPMRTRPRFGGRRQWGMETHRAR